MNHGTFAAMDADRNLSVIPGRRTMSITLWDFSEGEKYYSCFPPFHVSRVSIIESSLLMARCTAWRIHVYDHYTASVRIRFTSPRPATFTSKRSYDQPNHGTSEVARCVRPTCDCGAADTGAKGTRPDKTIGFFTLCWRPPDVLDRKYHKQNH